MSFKGGLIVTSDLKVRNLNSENSRSVILNLFLLIVIAIGLWFIVPTYFLIGDRNEIVLNMLFAAGIICFEVALEKYSVTITGMQEKFIINVLSVLYTFVCMCIVNLILFNVGEQYISDMIYALLAVVALTASDYILNKIFTNPKKYRKPRLPRFLNE